MSRRAVVGLVVLVLAATSAAGWRIDRRAHPAAARYAAHFRTEDGDRTATTGAYQVVWDDLTTGCVESPAQLVKDVDAMTAFLRYRDGRITHLHAMRLLAGELTGQSERVTCDAVASNLLVVESRHS